MTKRTIAFVVIIVGMFMSLVVISPTTSGATTLPTVSRTTTGIPLPTSTPTTTTSSPTGLPSAPTTTKPPPTSPTISTPPATETPTTPPPTTEPPLVEPPANSVDAPDMNPMPTFTPEYPPYGYLCVEYSPNTWSAVFNEDADTEAQIRGHVFRPFPNTAYGCSSYGNVATAEWEVPFGDTVPSFLTPAGAATTVEGTSSSFDSPQSEWGGENYKDPVPSSNPYALAGCNGKYRLQSSNWTTDVVQYPYFSLVYGTRGSRIRLSASAVYFFCPNGDKPDLVKVQEVRYIVTHPDGPPGPFENVRFHPLFADINTYHNAKTFVVNRDGDKKQILATQKFADADKRWLQVDQNAAWSMLSFVTLTNPSLDPEIGFNNGSRRSRRFLPYSDQELGAWVNYYG